MADHCNLPAGIKALGGVIFGSSGPDLGLCCACNQEKATAIIMINRRALIPGHGWGCFVCHQPSDGAAVVLCDHCRENAVPVRFVYCGFASADGRMPIQECSVEFDHDLSFHPGVGG